MPELRNVNVEEALAFVRDGALLLDVREDKRVGRRARRLGHPHCAQ